MCGVEAEDWYLTLIGKKEGKEKPVADPVPGFIESERCTKCDVPFSSFLKRRHHCRNCGHSFCQEHSDNRVPLPARGFYEPVRVCDDCRVKIWDKWERSKTCHLCERAFSAILRLHHCRKCGAPVCNECSPHRAPASGWNKRVRMCSACFSSLEPSDQKAFGGKGEPEHGKLLKKPPTPAARTEVRPRVEVSSDDDSEGKKFKPRMTA